MRSLTVALLLAISVSAAADYDALCDEMVSFAKLAAQSHNAGLESDAQTYRQKVKDTYAAAVKLDKAHPQAHLNYATFLMNSNEFEEAIKLFKAAEKGVGNDMRARGMIMSNVRRSQYGLYSMKRDAAYDHGKGDLFEALDWGEKQLAVSPEPHRTNHEVATINAMLCEYDVKACATAGSRFRIAANGAAQHYTTFRSHQLQGDQRGFLQCSHSRVHRGSWAGSKLVDTTAIASFDEAPASGTADTASVAVATARRRAGGVYVHVFNTAAQIIGPDGFVTVLDKADCTVFSPASDDYPNFADNLLPKTAAFAPRPNAPVHTVPVVSLVQFSAQSFYHWIAEALPRLVVAQRHLHRHTAGRTRFVVPRITNSTPFITATFDLLFPDTSSYELVEYVPGSVVRQQLTYVTWDKQPCPPSVADPDGANAPDSARTCPALAHPYALNRARDAITAAVRTGSWGHVRNGWGERLVVFAARGPRVTMRAVDDDALLTQIRHVLATEAAVIGPTELVVFDNSQSFEEALALFSRADVVIGVHGGALSNIIACKPGTTLIEIGFQADAAQHYQHMALSLGMVYRRVRVVADAHGRSLGAPTLRFSADAVMEALRFSLGCWMHSREVPQTGAAVTVFPIDGLTWRMTPQDEVGPAVAKRRKPLPGATRAPPEEL